MPTNFCVSGELRATGRIDFKSWFSSYFRFRQRCALGFGVLYSLVGGGSGLKATLRLAVTILRGVL